MWILLVVSFLVLVTTLFFRRRFAGVHTPSTTRGLVSEQKSLDFSPRGAYSENPLQETGYDDIKPFKNAYFPPEFLSGLEALFRADGRLASEDRLVSDIPCPYRVGGDLYFIPPEPKRQLRLFSDREPLPLPFNCDCPRARVLAYELGQRLPECSKHRCPVRFILEENT